MNNNNFHNMIKNTIDMCSYDFHVVTKIKEVKCPCVSLPTAEPNPGCKMCLGTGYKIRIRKVRGASNEVLENIAGRGAKGPEKTAIARNYFIDAKYKIQNEDIIVDRDEVLNVFRSVKMKGLDGEATHFEVLAIPKRQDYKLFVNNFLAILSAHANNNKKKRSR